MATDTYSDGTTYRDDAYVHEERRSYRDIGAQVFIWIAWAVAFGFWVFSMSIDAGIMRAIMAGGPNSLVSGGIGESGSGYFLMTVLGFIVLGVIIAYGAARYVTRDKRLDPATEAATAKIYDDAERGVRPYGAPGTRGRDDGDALRPA